MKARFGSLVVARASAILTTSAAPAEEATVPNDWDGVIRSIQDSVARAKRAHPTGVSSVPPRVSLPQDRCLHWSCAVRLNAGEVFCSSHRRGLEDGLVDECPGCARAKDAWQELCKECFDDPSMRRSTSRPLTWYRPEYVPRPRE